MTDDPEKLAEFQKALDQLRVTAQVHSIHAGKSKMSLMFEVEEWKQHAAKANAQRDAKQRELAAWQMAVREAIETGSANMPWIENRAAELLGS